MSGKFTPGPWTASEGAGYVVVPKADLARVTQGLVFDLLPASINVAISAYSPKNGASNE